MEITSLIMEKSWNSVFEFLWELCFESGRFNLFFLGLLYQAMRIKFLAQRHNTMPIVGEVAGLNPTGST